MRALLLVALTGCAPPAYEAPPVSGSVRALRELPPVVAAVALPCGVLDGNGATWGVDGEAAAVAWSGDAPHAAALGYGDADGDGLGDVVEVDGGSARIRLRRGAGPCSFAAPVEIGRIAEGFPRGVQIMPGRIVIGVSDTRSTVGAVLINAMGRWQQVTPNLRRGAPADGGPWRTYFYREESGCALAGLDTGAGWADGCDAPGFAEADPMGWAHVRVDGETLLWVSGIVFRTRLYSSPGWRWRDLAFGAGVAGEAETISWGAWSGDLDGDGRDDVIALTLTGADSHATQPGRPRVLLQLDGGRFANVADAIGAPRWPFQSLACVGAATCVVHGQEVAALVRFEVAPRPAP